jgi:hypothetical protein
LVSLAAAFDTSSHCASGENCGENANANDGVDIQSVTDATTRQRKEADRLASAAHGEEQLRDELQHDRRRCARLREFGNIDMKRSARRANGHDDDV